MREPGEIVAAFPRPGRVLKAVLFLIGVLAIAGAVVVHWVPGGERGSEIYSWLAFDPFSFLQTPIPRVWTLLTSGLLTYPNGVSHALVSLVGLYFLTTDLEKRWGGGRLLRFLALSVVVGNLFVFAGAQLPYPALRPRLPVVVGPLAAIIATAIAWSKENANRQIRFMFVFPMSGRMLFWLTIAIAFLTILFAGDAPEGSLAGLGGVFTGLLFGGTPSPVRALWLRTRLGAMRRRGGVTVSDLLEDSPRPRPSAKRGKSPALRVVPGGLEEDLKNRKLPKDKRYLN